MRVARARAMVGVGGRAAALMLLGCACAACGDPSPRERFEQEVAPLLERHCASATCHGVLPGAEAAGEQIDWSFLHLRVTREGLLADLDQAYDSARARLNTVEHVELSSLLRKPLSTVAGGLPHLGGAQMSDRGAAAYRTLLDWARSEQAAGTVGGEGEPFEALDELQQQFAREVLPIFDTRQCVNRACHGSFAPFTSFDAPVIVDGRRRHSVASIRASYKAARLHLNLGGDPMQSRLIRKTLQLEHGGIAHRGGNAIFFDGPDSPGVQAIAEWARAEQRAALGDASLEPSAVVFVRGPAAPAKAFEHHAFAPGGDLFVLDLADGKPDGAARNLTASAHDGPADVRDPAVRHDGVRVAFAMRRDAAGTFNIYEVGLDGAGLRQLTFDDGALSGGGRAVNVQPTYGPDGRVYFVSTRAGVVAEGLDVLDSDIWAVDPESGALERMTHEPSPQVSASFIGTGKSYGTLAFTMRRTIGDRYEAPVLRGPLDHDKAHHADPELHIHHGVTAGFDIVYAMRTMADGRFACVALSRDDVWRAGKLQVFDRQLGPEIPRGLEDQAATGGFRHAFSTLSEDLYRHPVPLGDGRLLLTKVQVAAADDPSASPAMGVYVATLAEDPASGEPRLESVEALIDEPGVAEYDAEPVVVRPLEDDPSHKPGGHPDDDRGVVAFRHVETLEAIQSHLPQIGPRPLRDDLRYLRLIEWQPLTPNDLASPVGASSHGLGHVLGEVELRGGSVLLSVPANRPFRVQYLDADRMAVGAQHNRWVSVAPGETFPGGVSPALYPTLCAGCHGALSGDPTDVGGPVPDLITGASITEATHEQRNPRRPRDPEVVGEAPIGVDFARDIAPLLDRSCRSCHSGAAPAGGLDLEGKPTGSYDSSYQGLLATGEGSTGGRRYVDAEGSSAFGSYLMEVVLGRELRAPRALDRACSGEPALSDAEQLVLVRWIDLGAPYRGVAP